VRRIDSIDALRGLVMVIMALDHVRDFVHRGAMTGSPTDLATTTPVLFFTRWITHLCAPAFMLTAGLGAYLWWQRGRTRGELSVFLLTRGLWLIVLEVTVMRLAYNFSFSGEYPLFLIVLWALGGCMIALAALVWLPLPALAALSLAAIAGHNLLDGFDPARLGAAASLWNVIHQPGPLQLPWGTAFVAYPLVPWVAVMALGFCLGPAYGWDSSRRARLLARTRRGRDRGVRDPPSDQPVRRPGRLGRAAVTQLHSALIPQHYQIPPVARLPPDDAGARPADAGLARATGNAVDQSIGGLRPGSAVLLRAALLRGAPFGGGAVARHLWVEGMGFCLPPGPLDGRAEHVVPRRVRLGPVGRVPGLGGHRGRPVPTLPLVRGDKARRRDWWLGYL
jgi:hypothetical protein